MSIGIILHKYRINSKFVRFILGNIITLLIILYVTSKYEQREPIIAPYGLLMLAIVCTTAIGGLVAGLFSASLVSGFTIYSYLTGFDPTMITSHPLNSLFGIIIFYTQSIVLGVEKLRRDRTLTKLEETRDLLEDEITNKENKLNLALEKAMLVEKGNTLGQFAVGISHDFNNILHSILNLAELTMLTEPSKEAKEFQQSIIQQSEVGSKLIQQIIDFTRNSTAEEVIIELNEFLQNFTQHSQRMLTQQFKTIFVPSDPLYIKFDLIHLNQILMNIIANAKDAIEQNGIIEIKIYKDVKQNKAVIAISDNGTGISPEILPKIFEPYITTKSRSEGTGLGLAQVWGLVHKYNGEIKVQTEQGYGTTFIISLPCIEIM